MKNVRKKNAKRVLAVFATLALTGVMVSGTTLTAFAAVNHTDTNAESQNKAGIFYTDYSKPTALMDAAKELAEEIGNEGMVLMQNNNAALPLQAGARVTVFGKSSINPAYGGGGSGALIGVEPVSLYDGLHNAGFKTNGVVEEFYKNNNLSGTGRSDKTYVNETPKTAYTRAIKESYAAYGDAAIVVITRTGAEGSDLPRTGATQDGGAKYLSITQNEKDMIAEAKANFGKVILLVNSSNTVELGEIKDDVDSILWIGNPGERGFNSVGKILNGEVNPSGRLSDTYVSDLTMDPTWANFGNNSQNEGVQVVTTSVNRQGQTEIKYEKVQYNALKDTGNTVTADMTVAGAPSGTSLVGQKIYEKAGTYTEYEEGIYVGYRYYETRAYEMNQADTTDQNAGQEWYNGLVDFAFGEGLSYTDFTWTVKSDTSALTLTKNGKITVDVEVENTGDVAGKDVVQLYYGAPYFADGIEKSVVNLGAFAKTELLQPGEKQTVTLEMAVQDMASFDWNDANGNGFRGYELEAGTYNFYLGTGSHCWATAESAMKFTATVANDAADTNFKTEATAGKGTNGLTYTKDKNTGNDIKVLFSNDDIYNTNLMQNENKLKRSSFATASTTENIIQEKTVEDFVLSEAGWNQLKKTGNLFSIDKDASDYYAFEGEEHAPWYKTAADVTGWKQYDGTAEARPAPTYTFADMAGKSYDDPAWETLLNELTWQELKDIVYVAGFTNAKIDYIGKDRAIDDDGPMQVKLNQSPLEGTNDDFTGSGWPCAVLVASTWNVELAERQGVMIGNECLYLGISGWFAPAMNLHRNQYGGRIFEYYSSDPIQGGKIAAVVTRGVQSKGVYAFLKHFCLNNQDTGRGSISIVVNEQAMRELYMNTFQIAVEEGGAHGLMTYYSFVGGVSIMSNYAILTEFVRNQWGFQGVINHDYGPESHTGAICTPALTRRVGNGMGGNGSDYGRYSDMDCYKNGKVYFCLDANGRAVAEGQEVESPTHWWAIRESAKQLLWTTANSNNQHNKLDLSLFEGKALTAKQDIAFNGVTVGAGDIGTDMVTYELHSGKLPAGVTLNEYTGALTGTTLETGTFEFEVRMRADFWIKKTEAFTLTVAPTVAIATDDALVSGTEFYGTIEAESFEGATDVTYTVVEGMLPEGLTLNGETGEIEGTPAAPGTFEAVVRIHGVVDGVDGRGRPTKVNKDADFKLTFTVTGKTATEAELDAAKVKIEALETSLNGATAGLGTANGKIDQMQNKLDEMQSALDAANGKIAELEAKQAESGCNGSVVTASVVVGLPIVLLGALLVAKRVKASKKED